MISLMMIHKIHPMPPISLLFDPMRFSFIVLLNIFHRRRYTDGLLRIITLMPLRRFKFRMNGFMGQIHKKGLPFIPSFIHPFHCKISQNIGYITFYLPALPIDIQHWIKIHSLTSETNPSAKSWFWVVACLSDMPFSEKGSFISLFLKLLWKKHCFRFHRVIIIHSPVSKSILAGKNRSSAW